MSRTVIGCILAAFICLLSLTSTAQPGAEADAALRGVSSLSVVVDSRDRDLRSAGVTAQNLKSNAEVTLRSAGIKVVSPEPHSPYLHIIVTLRRAPDTSLYAFWIEVSFKQAATLRRDPSVWVTATTWSTGVVGAVSDGRLQDVRAVVLDYVSAFANDLLVANR